jgi:hypothetical protein
MTHREMISHRFDGLHLPERPTAGVTLMSGRAWYAIPAMLMADAGYLLKFGYSPIR